jgi:hypothetical protein
MILVLVYCDDVKESDSTLIMTSMIRCIRSISALLLNVMSIMERYIEQPHPSPLPALVLRIVLFDSLLTHLWLLCLLTTGLSLDKEKRV